MLTTVMIQILSDGAEMERTEAAAGRLAGARILVLEKCFEALVEQMIEDGAEPANAAAVMLEHLVERFAMRRLAS
jgi:hypothetical protein